MKQKKLIFVFVLLLVTALLLSSCSLFSVTKSGDYAADYLTEQDLPPFSSGKFKAIERAFNRYTVYDLPDGETMAAKVADLYRENYAGKIDEEDEAAVTDALLACYVYATGDRYAHYRPEEEFNAYQDDMSGEFVGIGVNVESDREKMTVVGVIEGSPAEAAGILPGDDIVAVEGTRFADAGREGIVSLIRGERGTTVKVTVMRGGKEIDLFPVRDEIHEKTVTYSVEGEIGIVKMTGFKSNTAAQFREAIDALEAAGVKAILFDERKNPGGYVSSVVDCLSYLVPRGTQIFSSSGQINESMAANSDHTVDLPFAVLCGPYTASGGELFTAALRDFREMGLMDTVIVGETTYKKGVMQNTYPFSDGSALTLTVALYYPPSGVNYDGVGVIPDEGYRIENTGEEDAQKNAAVAALRDMIAQRESQEK